MRKQRVALGMMRCWRLPRRRRCASPAVRLWSSSTSPYSSASSATGRQAADGAFVVHGPLTELARGELPRVGIDAWVSHTFCLHDAQQFAALSGDSNPIHTQEEEDPAQCAVVQGLLSGSLFATIFGRTIPGAVYVSQSLRWRVPLFVDEEVRAHIRVVRLRKRFVDCETVCTKTRDGSVVVEGQATVLLPAAPATATA